MTPVAPSTSAAASASASALATLNGRNQLGKDAFLKLLVAQLKNQDPQNPADSSQMAAQLAQFSSVEQLTNISKTLDSQSTSQATLIEQVAAGAASGNIGRVITASSELMQLDGSGNEKLLITGNGGPATLNIFDANTGAVITSRNMGSLRSGTNEIVVGTALRDLPAGVYRVTVTSTDTANPARWTTAVRGTVTGVETTSRGLQYEVGRLLIPITSVTAITTK